MADVREGGERVYEGYEGDEKGGEESSMRVVKVEAVGNSQRIHNAQSDCRRSCCVASGERCEGVCSTIGGVWWSVETCECGFTSVVTRG